jgi:hypothetical protein
VVVVLVVMVLVPVALVFRVVVAVVEVIHVIAVLNGFMAAFVAVNVLVRFFVLFVDDDLRHNAPPF